MINWNDYYKKITTKNTSDSLNKIKDYISDVCNTKSYTVDYRKKGYIVKSHIKPLQQDYNKAKKIKPFRKEEWMCKLALGKSFNHVGKIVDYQVPLKVNGSSAGKGKIDLLSVVDETAYLLEVKVPESTESPLRAIMEIYTYWQQLGGNSKDTIDNFVCNSKANGANVLKKAIVIFAPEKETEKPKKSSIYYKLKSNEKEYKNLMSKLCVECFIATANGDIITNITTF